MIIKKNNQKLGVRKKVQEQIQQPVVEEIVSPQSAENDQVEEVIEAPVEVQPEPVQELPKEPEIDLFDIESIDFTQRQERRRGSRRRGYRRIDDRNLVSRAQEESENIKKSAFWSIHCSTAFNNTALLFIGLSTSNFFLT